MKEVKMTLAGKPFFSIIVPCCDVEPYVKESLMSVMNQPFQDWECIIGIETSKDKTEEVIRELTANDLRFRIFTGPRSGSCSASRNTGIDMAQGEYVIFLDGDDAISEDSLQRLYDRIMAWPGGDIYPCGMRRFNCLQQMRAGEHDLVFNEFPEVSREMNGTEATVLYLDSIIGCQWMMQLFVFRMDFLRQHGLKCIYGVNGQDYVFSQQAIYLAKHIMPLHEAYYNYRIRPRAVASSITFNGDPGKYYHNLAICFHVLLMFYSSVSEADDFDSRVASSWGKFWIGRICFEWFFPCRISRIPRVQRSETLKELFADGFDSFEKLRKVSHLPTRCAGWWIRVFITHPHLRGGSELFFKAYFSMHHLKNTINKHKGHII